jgi:hypothetical protein
MIEIQGIQTGAEMPVRVTLPARQHAAVQSAPSPMVLFRIKLVWLVDVKPSIVASLLDERRLGGGETRHDHPLSL